MTDQHPTTYTDRQIDFIYRAESESFSKDEIVDLIKEFSESEYEKRRADLSKMPFGKFKGKTIKSIATFDKQYLQWLVKQTVMEKWSDLREEIKTHL